MNAKEYYKINRYSKNMFKYWEFERTQITGELEKWSDEKGNIWEVPIEIERHFEQAEMIYKNEDKNETP